MKVPADKLLAELIIKHKHAIWKIHDHDSLLEHQVDQEISGNIADVLIVHNTTSQRCVLQVSFLVDLLLPY